MATDNLTAVSLITGAPTVGTGIITKFLTWAEYGAAIDELGQAVPDYAAQGEAYFFGSRNLLSSYAHQGGYSNYLATNYLRTDYGNFLDESIARREAESALDPSPVPYFYDLASLLTGRYNVNQTFVELGTGLGLLPLYARQQGIDAWGVDVSQYAYDQADPAIQPYLTVQDALSWLQGQKRNGWDIIVSRGFLPCFDDIQVAELVTEMNRVSRQQLHLFLPVPKEFYNVKTLQEWADAFDWEVGTVLVREGDWANYVTVIN